MNAPAYNWFITQRALPTNASFVNSKQWLQAGADLGFLEGGSEVRMDLKGKS